MPNMHLNSISLIIIIIVSGIVNAAPPPPPPGPTIGDDNLDENSSQIDECSDGIKNNDESDIDCGGSCAKCADDKTCNEDNECSSDYCNPKSLCSIPTCTDEIKNGNETDIDCGGSCKMCEDQELQGAAKVPTDDEVQNNDGVNSGIQENEDQITLPTESNTETEYEEISIQLDALKSTINSISAPDKSSSNSSNIMLGISLTLNFLNLLILAVLGVLFIRNSNTNLNISSGNSPKSNSSQLQVHAISKQPYSVYANSKNNSILNLKKYIQRSMDAGYSEDSLKQVLMLKNWPEEEIVRAFLEVKNGRRRAF
jgi:hypothetical protein